MGSDGHRMLNFAEMCFDMGCLPLSSHVYIGQERISLVGLGQERITHVGVGQERMSYFIEAWPRHERSSELFALCAKAEA